MDKIKLPTKKFWNKKKIFITGHTSYKGTWLLIWLKELGAILKGYSNSYPSHPLSLSQLLFKKKIIKSHNILNYKNILNELKKFNPQIVFHMAAESIVSESHKNPLKTFKTNIIGTANLIEACRNVESIEIVVIITTDKCYEENDKVISFKENSILGGSEPYSASKASAEIIAKSYVNKLKQKNKKIITLRAGNVIGGGDWKKDRLVPDLYKNIFEKKKIIFRNLDSVRPWQHVLDCLNGYLLATEYSYNNKLYYNTWNFSSKLIYQKKVKWLVREIFKKNKIDLKYSKKKEAFYENPKLNLNSKKAKRELGWFTTLNGEKLINFVDFWYRSFYQNKNVKKLCLFQLKQFYKLNSKKL